MKRPDATLTPGAYGTVKVPRDVSRSVKRHIFAAYEIKLWRRPFYTIDHLVPLELCGTNSPTNLWPQPRREARMKDLDESRLAAEVRAGTRTLIAAQHDILAKWGP